MWSGAGDEDPGGKRRPEGPGQKGYPGGKRKPQEEGQEVWESGGKGKPPRKKCNP